MVSKAVFPTPIQTVFNKFFIVFFPRIQLELFSLATTFVNSLTRWITGAFFDFVCQVLLHVLTTKLIKFHFVRMK